MSVVRRGGTGLVVMVLVAALWIAMPQRAQASHAIDYIYYATFKNVQTQQCLEVLNYYVHDGAPVVQHPCTGGTNQQWKVIVYKTGYERLVNVHSGKCLEVVNYYVHPGAKLAQWACHGGANQLWYDRDYLYPKSAIHAIANKHSSLCMDAPGYAKFTQVQQWECNRTDWQQWFPSIWGMRFVSG